MVIITLPQDKSSKDSPYVAIKKVTNLNINHRLGDQRPDKCHHSYNVVIMGSAEVCGHLFF